MLNETSISFISLLIISYNIGILQDYIIVWYFILKLNKDVYVKERALIEADLFKTLYYHHTVL